MLDLRDHKDHRKWTQQHLDAADLRIPSIAPTPPQGELENDCMDINVKRPGEYSSLFNQLTKGSTLLRYL